MALTAEERKVCEDATAKLNKLNGVKLGQAYQFLSDLVEEKVTVRRSRPLSDRDKEILKARKNQLDESLSPDFRVRFSDKE